MSPIDDTPEAVRSVPFQGRAQELHTLHNSVAELRDGIGSAVRITGVAGSGKTRLVHEALHQTEVPVCRGTAYEAEQGRPFAALVEALGIDLPRSASPSDQAAVSGDATWIAIDRLVESVESRVGNGQLILVLDDIQWADRGTWMAAASLARRAHKIGLLLITMHRPLATRAAPPVPLSALGASIVLEPLTRPEAHAIATTVLGRRLSPETVAQLDRAAGNPFFTIAVARWLDELEAGNSDMTIDDEVELPQLLQASVLNRVQALGTSATEVLRAAALMGRRVTIADLCVLVPRPVDDVVHAVEDAVTAGLLIDDGKGIAFRHDLVRSVIRSTTPPSAVAAQLELETNGQVADPWAAKQLASLTDVGDERSAQVILEAARAPGVSPEIAAELFEEVLRIGPGTGVARLDVEAELLVALATGGDLDYSSERADKMLDRHAGDDPADPKIARLRRFAARIEFGQGHVDRAIETLRTVATDDGLVAQQAGSDLLLMEVLTIRRPGAVDDARRIRETTSDPITRCNAELAVAVSAMRAGRLVESVEAATSAVAQTALDPTLTAEIHPEIFLADSLFYAERFDEATDALAHAQVAAKRAEVVWPIPHHLALVAGAGLRTGDLEGAAIAAQEAVEWSLDTGQRIGATWPHVFTAIAAVHQGDLEEAIVALKRAEADLADGQWQGAEGIPWAAALVAEVEGHQEVAVQRLAPIVELAAAVNWTIRVPLLAPDVARMAWAIDDEATLARMVELTESAAEVLPTVEAAAAAERCRGFAENRVESLEAAAHHYAEIGSITQAGSTWAEAAVVAARVGDHDRAVDLFERQARPQLEHIGAAGVLRRTTDALPVRVQRRVSRQAPRPTMGIEALTPAERRVCELVAEGADNTEIAKQLSVSRRTVESHISRSYRKLGVSSRIRLAALALPSLDD